MEPESSTRMINMSVPPALVSELEPKLTVFWKRPTCRVRVESGVYTYVYMCMCEHAWGGSKYMVATGLRRESGARLGGWAAERLGVGGSSRAPQSRVVGVGRWRHTR